MSDKVKTEADKDVQDALDEGQPLPEGTVYAPYNNAATGSPLPEGLSADELNKRARGYDEPTKPKSTRTKTAAAKEEPS